MVKVHFFAAALYGKTKSNNNEITTATIYSQSEEEEEEVKDVLAKDNRELHMPHTMKSSHQAI